MDQEQIVLFAKRSAVTHYPSKPVSSRESIIDSKIEKEVRTKLYDLSNQISTFQSKISDKELKKILIRLEKDLDKYRREIFDLPL